MSSEITRRDHAHKTVPKTIRIPYGRGSKVRVRYNPIETYVLIKPQGEFWVALTGRNQLVSISQGNIEEVLIDGHWKKFTNKSREWKRFY